jgi:Zn-dependent peptidase ImmA (M78 family)
MHLPPETFVKCVRTAQASLVKYFSKPNTPSGLAVPVDVEQLATALGFQVVRIHSVTDEFSGLVSPKHKLIGVNGNHHVHRQRFTVAHEIGHIVLNHPPESHCTQNQIDEYNREADVCASELLIPTQLIAPHLLESRMTSVSTLSKLFDVSEEAMSMKIQNIQEFRLAMK